MCWFSGFNSDIKARAETVERGEEKAEYPSDWVINTLNGVSASWRLSAAHRAQKQTVYVCGNGREGWACVYGGDIETEEERQSVHSEKFHPERLQLAGMKPEYFIWLERAQKKTRREGGKKEKRRLRLQNESVCLKVLHFTWLHPSHILYMGFVASVQLCNHVPEIGAL